MSQKTKTILFTDIKSSSILWKTHGVQKMVKALDDHDKRIRKYADEFQGTIIKTSGDSYMIAFSKWQNAFYFCLEFQYNEHHHPLYIGKDTLKIRIGFCHGKVMEKHVLLQGHQMVDYFGTMVNKASRLESGVSDVGHFAFGFDKPLTKEPVFPESDIDYSVTIEEYSNSCHSNEDVKNSRRLFNARQHHCHAEGDLKGVGEVVAYKINIHF